jgi:hypothetical protein
MRNELQQSDIPLNQGSNEMPRAGLKQSQTIPGMAMSLANAGICNFRLRRVALKVLAIIGLTLIGTATAQAAIPASERAVLQDLYLYTDGADWYPPARAGWNGAPGSECSWFGITCNSQGNSVIAIRLAGVQMYGSLPALSGLPNLEVLDVRTTASGGFTFHNDLYGSIPPLSGLTKLREFRANNSPLSGSIPSLEGLVNLHVFECRFCGLSGGIPPLNELTQLETFDVTENQLSGPLPALAGLTSLSVFSVRRNHLNGSLPAVAGLSNLQIFDAYSNLFSGDVPDLTGMPRLEIFSAARNQLDGQIRGLSALPKLTSFDVSENLLTGNIPSLADLPLLHDIQVNANRLTGNIPALSSLTHLEGFYASYNQLSGSLPEAPSSLLLAPDLYGNGNARVCPNRLTPENTPPSMTDLDWETVTRIAPWSQDCVANPLWKTTFSLSTSLNPAFVGETVAFTALVWGMNPTGTVSLTARSNRPFHDNPMITLCEDVPLLDSKVTCTTDNLQTDGSSISIFFHYSGDSQNAPIDRSLDAVASLNVRYQPTVITTTANPAMVGEPVDLVGARGPGDDDDGPMYFYEGRVLLCGDVPVHDKDGQMTGHCIARFTTPGPHSIFVIHNPGNFYAETGFVPLIQNVVAAAPFDADQFALTGAWYNPVTSGQGFSFQAFPDHAGSGIATMGGDWQTFDAVGHQNWFTVQGNLTQSHGSTYNLAIGQTAGGNFDALPISPASLVGNGSLTFHDCTHATLEFSLNDGRSGTIPYVRLAPPSACSTAVPAVMPPASQLPEHYNDVLHSGAWYDPATSGQGLQVEFIPSRNTFLASWVTYAPQGSPSTGIERQRSFALEYHDYTPGDLSISGIPIIATSGGVFNQPSTVARVQVGSADVVFTSCTSMTMTYTFTEGEFAGLSGTINQTTIVPNPACR